MPDADGLYRRLITPVEARMISLIGRIVRDKNDAEDVLQETLAVVWAKLAKIERHPNPHAYILRICLSRSYDALRKRARRNRGREPFYDQQAAGSAGGPESGETDEKLNAVREAVALLPPKQGKAVMLRAMDGLLYQDIGGILGCAESTARSHFAKGKARVRKTLKRRGLIGL